MGYPAPPLAYCTGTWPAGPFATPAGVASVPGDLTAARAVANVASALTGAREDRSWSRATLAHRAGLAPHTVGRIEAGQTWPDLATIALLADALDLELALVPTRPAAVTAHDGRPVDEPLRLELSGVDEPTAAHVIEAILNASPRIAGSVDTLRRKRRSRS